MPDSVLAALLVGLVAALLWRSRGALTWEPVYRRGHEPALPTSAPQVVPEPPPTPLKWGNVIQARPLPTIYRWKTPQGPAFVFVDTEDTAEAARAVALHPLFFAPTMTTEGL